jgi:peptidoglycan LD-endopeptidase LytH
MLPIPPRTRLACAAALLCAACIPAVAAAQARLLVPLPLGLVTPASAAEDASLLPVPVEGVPREALRDSYTQARGRGRVHNAIDIHAPRGTPVIAVAAGRILKLHSGNQGGLSIYLLDDDGRTRYYYAHLDRYVDGLREGQRVVRGQLIGYVGDTGNAAPGDYHLHFSVAILSDPALWWQGRNLNPYPLMRGTAAAR